MFVKQLTTVVLGVDLGKKLPSGAWQRINLLFGWED
jgi:hypothetical protein